MAEYIETHGNTESSGEMDTGDWDLLIHGHTDGSVTVKKDYRPDTRHKDEGQNFEPDEGADLLEYVAECLNMNEKGEMFSSAGTSQNDRERYNGPQVTVSAGEESEEE